MTKNNINRALEEEASPQEYTITKSLKLETVNEGSNEDDVLVRGNDNTVKYVSQSSLGGGGSQTLQQLYDKNSALISDTPFDIQNTTLPHKISLTPQQLTIYNSSISEQFQFDGANKRITSSGNDGFTIFNIPINIGQFPSFSLPPKNTGNYILATIDDINGAEPQGLQSVLSSGNNATGVSMSIGDESKAYSLITANTISNLDAIYGRRADVLPYGFFISSNNDNNRIAYYTDDVTYATQDDLKSNRLIWKRLTDGKGEYKFPEKPSGTYTLATTDDIKGGSQNLQQILDQSPQTATVRGSEGKNEISLGRDFSSYRYDLDDRITNYIANESNYVKMGGQGTAGNSSSHLTFVDGEFELVKVAPNTGYGTNISIETPIAPTNLKFPAKPAGTYTLATLEDVSIPSLQQVYDKGRTISTDTGLIIEKTSSPNQGHTAIDGEVIEIYDNISQGINISKNKILGYGINKNNIIDFSKTTISQSTYKFPEKTDGTYVFATTSDLAVDDPAIWSKSKTELNTEYPNAINGFRVHCPYISTGATIYEKTSIGWVEYPIKLVYDPE